MLKIVDLYDLSHSMAGEYLTKFTYPWEALKGIKEEIIRLGQLLDKEAYTEQAKYVSQFDRMMKEGKIQKVAVISKKDVQEMERLEVKPAIVVPVDTDDEDYSEYLDKDKIRGLARASV